MLLTEVTKKAAALRYNESPHYIFLKGNKLYFLSLIDFLEACDYMVTIACKKPFKAF